MKQGITISRVAAFVVVVPIGFWMAMQMQTEVVARSNTAAHTLGAAGVAHFDVNRGTYVAPSATELSELQAETATLKALRSEVHLREEPAPSEAGGVRVRLGPRYQSAMRVTTVGEAVDVSCAESQEGGRQ